jgi:hypothetical protein
MTPEQLHILRHSLGLSQFDRIEKSYRNRYCSDSNPDIEALVAAGLMKRSAYSGDGLVAALWVVTEAGILAVRDARVEPKKLTRSQLRYREYLKCDCGEKFIDFLRWRYGKKNPA